MEDNKLVGGRTVIHLPRANLQLNPGHTRTARRGEGAERGYKPLPTRNPDAHKVCTPREIASFARQRSRGGGLCEVKRAGTSFRIPKKEMG